jgi:hypothetical protein
LSAEVSQSWDSGQKHQCTNSRDHLGSGYLPETG